MGAKGRLSVRVHPTKDWRTGDEGYRIIVADNGPGIPKDVRKNLFTAFYSTKGEKGTGLGLWITKQLVQKHGGRIRLRSCQTTSEGKSGTMFWVWLPLRRDFTADVSPCIVSGQPQ